VQVRLTSKVVLCGSRWVGKHRDVKGLAINRRPDIEQRRDVAAEIAHAALWSTSSLVKVSKGADK
jgi:hypothetical protein